MKKLLCVVMVLLVASVAQADGLIPVGNQSFETPIFNASGEGSYNWNGSGDDAITGWSYDYTAGCWPSIYGTSVKWSNDVRDAVSPDGTRNVAVVVHSSVTAPTLVTGPWQDLGYEIVADETYTFSMDVLRGGTTAYEDQAISLTFNSHEGGVRTPLNNDNRWIDISEQATHVNPHDEVLVPWVTHTVSFTAMDGADYIGASLGIEFNNESLDSGNTYHLFDNAVVVPEPATMMLLGLGSLALLKRRRA